MNHGWTRMDTDLQEEIEQTGRRKVQDRKMRKESKRWVRKMGAVTKFFDLRLLKVRLCADDLSFAQMAVEARRKAVTIF